MKVGSKSSQRAKTIEKNCSTSKEYLGRTTYLRASVTSNALDSFCRQSNGPHEAHRTFFVQPDRKFLEESTKVKETYFSAMNPWEKSAPAQNLHEETLLYTLPDSSSSFQVICITLRKAKSVTLRILQKKLLKIHFFEQKISGKLLWKKKSAKDWMQLTLLFSSPNFHCDAIHGKLG